MTPFISNASSNNTGVVKTYSSSEATHNGVDLSPESLMVVDAVVDSLKSVGVKTTSVITTTEISDDSVFLWMKEIDTNNVNPLKCNVLIQSKGYEAYKPSKEMISRAGQYTGSLKSQMVYLLRTDDGFFLSHEQKMIAYRKCRS